MRLKGETGSRLGCSGETCGSPMVQNFLSQSSSGNKSCTQTLSAVQGDWEVNHLAGGGA